MAKALPYFKFYCSEWSDGDVTLEDMKTQGVFINICSYYWSQECEVFEEKLQKRFKSYTKQIENLKKEKIIFSENGKVVIRFLNKQWTEREALKQRNQKNGASGGRPKKTQSVNTGKPNENPNKTNIEEKREEENKEDIKSKPKSAEVAIPEFIDLELWGSFIEMRKKLKAVNSPTAIKALIKKLTANKDMANAMIEQSVVNSWKGIFDIKINYNQDSNKAVSAQTLHDHGSASIDDGGMFWSPADQIQLDKQKNKGR